MIEGIAFVLTLLIFLIVGFGYGFSFRSSETNRLRAENASLKSIEALLEQIVEQKEEEISMWMETCEKLCNKVEDMEGSVRSPSTQDGARHDGG